MSRWSNVSSKYLSRYEKPNLTVQLVDYLCNMWFGCGSSSKYVFFFFFFFYGIEIQTQLVNIFEFRIVLLDRLPTKAGSYFVLLFNP